MESYLCLLWITDLYSGNFFQNPAFLALSPSDIHKSTGIYSNLKEKKERAKDDPLMQPPGDDPQKPQSYSW